MKIAEPVIITIILFIYLFFWLCRAAREILVPRPGIKPMPPALGVQSLTHCTSREVPLFF